MAEHRDIIEAMLDRDAPRAAAAARAHVRSSWDNMQKIREVAELRRTRGSRMPMRNDD
ncbi:MAG: hypothetical protein P8X66_05880 [Maritimibacter sp.]